uniref:Uncharacterized protein n=1 Tax=Arundo donax TaxID=35708 RepID=A0A0A9AZV1_ARUDO
MCEFRSTVWHCSTSIVELLTKTA